MLSINGFFSIIGKSHFRTIRGYMTLIEKNFLTVGHQFRLKNRYYSKEENNENQNSQILLQYLYATTHQLLVQYPMYFEFIMKFLLFIANSINSGLCGTFLYNNEKEREVKNVKTNTMSCWSEILININQYKMYNRLKNNSNEIKPLENRNIMNNKNQLLISEFEKLKKELNDMKDKYQLLISKN